MSESRKQGVVFDMDGTLTKKGASLWAEIDKHAISPQCKAYMDELREQYMPAAFDGTLSPQGERDWLVKTIEGYIQDGLTMSSLMLALFAVSLRQGAIECLKMLENHGIPTAIVSYGLNQAIAEVLRINGLSPNHSLFKHIYAARLIVEPDTRRIAGYNKYTLVVPSNKQAFSNQFAIDCDIEFGDVLAVGDSVMDRSLCSLKKNRLGIAADAKAAKKLEQYMGTVIVTQDFDPITAWLKHRLGI